MPLPPGVRNEVVVVERDDESDSAQLYAVGAKAEILLNEVWKPSFKASGVGRFCY